MTRPNQTSKKREKEKNKQKKRKEKEQRKEDRKKHSTKGLGLNNLIVSAIEQEQAAGKVQDDTASEMPAAEVKIGKVVYLNAPKSYGFIRDAHVKENLFFNTEELKWEVRLNDLVTFTRTKSSRGGTATSIEKIV